MLDTHGLLVHSPSNFPIDYILSLHWRCYTIVAGEPAVGLHDNQSLTFNGISFVDELAPAVWLNHWLKSCWRLSYCWPALMKRKMTEIINVTAEIFNWAPGSYQRLDLFIKVLRILCPNLTDVSLKARSCLMKELSRYPMSCLAVTFTTQEINSKNQGEIEWEWTWRQPEIEA